MKYFILLLLLLSTQGDQIRKEDVNQQQKPENQKKDCEIPQTYMSYYGCEVYVGECAWGYTYYACRQQYCSQYYTQKDKDGRTNTYCIQYSYRYFTQQNCLYQCCGDVAKGNLKFTPDVLSECKQENSRLTKRFWMIVLGIFVTIGAIAFCVWAYETCQRKFRRQYIY